LDKNDKNEDIDEPEPVAEDANKEGDGTTAVVFDIGSIMMKVGLAGEDDPTVFSTIVWTYEDMEGEYVGDEDKVRDRKQKHLSFPHYPVWRGSVFSWDLMEKIWHHAFNELRILPEESNVLLTAPPMSSKAMREKMTEIMFEKFSTPAMTVKNQAPLSLYACGYTTGVVVQSGHGVSYSTPISEGFIVSGVSCEL